MKNLGLLLALAIVCVSVDIPLSRVYKDQEERSSFYKRIFARKVLRGDSIYVPISNYEDAQYYGPV
jgi:hypothetical protein